MFPRVCLSLASQTRTLEDLEVKDSESVAYFTEKWPHMRDVDCRRYATCADRAAEVSPDELRPDFQEAGQENS